MGAAGDLRAHQGGLRVEYIRVDPLQIGPALIIIAVASGSGKVSGVYPIFLHGSDDLALVEFCHLVNSVKAGPQVRSTRSPYS